MDKKVVLAIVGGSGLYNLEGLNLVKEHSIATPFGNPSDAVKEFEFNGRTIFFLARHGQGHCYNPSEVNYRANIYALKSLGVTDAIAVSSVGILADGIVPSDLIIVDQLFDRTKRQDITFFEKGIVAHVPFADPFCENVRSHIKKVAISSNISYHDGGTLVVIEGPTYSTRAESLFYREVLKATCVGMTALPESKLFKEAGICFGMVAMATDYDCWKQDEKSVSSDMVVEASNKNFSIVSKLLKEFILTYPKSRQECGCELAIKTSIVTKDISEDTRKRLSLILKN